MTVAFSGDPHVPAIVRFGTRGSALARAQTDLVVRALRACWPEVECRIVVIRTEGDIDKTSPLTAIGGRGVFTSALQAALRQGEIDVAVHSAKDLPTERPDDLVLAAFFSREDPRDVFVSRHGRPLSDLGPNPLIGTSSRRRAVQVLKLRPDARIADLRGNVDTRLRRAMESDLDGIVLAAAGVRRMGWQDRITEYLPLDVAVPSPGQGALAIEIRTGDEAMARLVACVDDQRVTRAVRVERAFLRGIGGGCTTPIGAHATLDGEALTLQAMLAAEDGSQAAWLTRRLEGPDPEGDAEALAVAHLRRLRLRQGVAVPGALDPVRPLAGLRVLVTRESQDDGLQERLADLGAEPVPMPVIAIEPVPDAAPVQAAVRRLGEGEYDWVVFTSGNAVEQFLRHAGEAAPGPLFAGTRVAAVGTATARRLDAAGVPVQVIPNQFTGESLVAALRAAGVAGARVLFPRGNLARETVPAGLHEAGATVDQVEVYRTVPARAVDPAVLARVQAGDCDVAIFLSPSAVRNTAALLGGTLDALGGALMAAIGPVTATALAAAGARADVVPDESTIDGLLAALVLRAGGMLDAVAASSVARKGTD